MENQLFEQDIENLIQRAGNALIGSIDEEGYPNIKAMLPPRKREGIQIIYFSTNTSSERVKQFRTNPKASLYFFDAQAFQGVLLKGNMQVLETPEYKEMLWQKGDNLYYPLGVTDPDYCVLVFQTETVHYYANLSSTEWHFE